MATLSTKKIDKSLRKKGFVVEEKDHHFYYYINNGKKTGINTKTSHGKSEIGDSLIARMSKQLYLSKTEFIELVQCTLSGEKYKEILLDKKII